LHHSTGVPRREANRIEANDEGRYHLTMDWSICDIHEMAAESTGDAEIRLTVDFGFQAS
jgi:hypothetical protein